MDELFPMSRAVQESHVVGACLRFSIEYALLGVLQGVGAVRDTTAEQGRQAGVVAQWKQRCGAQLDMMGMCRASGVYQMIPEVEREQECPFVIAEAYEGRPAGQRYYVTPGCLVYKEQEDAFYDPCTLSGEVCTGQSPGGSAVLHSVSLSCSLLYATCPLVLCSTLADHPSLYLFAFGRGCVVGLAGYKDPL